MPLQKIEDVPNPEVGRHYLMPCSLLLASHSNSRKPAWVPLIGPWHEDADIGIATFHFHYDARFLTAQILGGKDPAYYIGRVHTAGCHPDSCGIMGATPPPIEYKRRKMLRQMPDFPGHGAFTLQLESKFKRHELKCLTCPHRGMSLQGLPQDDQGRVICNGHGLRWNLKTKRLSPR